MPDAFKRYVTIECEKLSVQELKEYMKELAKQLSESEPGEFDYAIILAMLNIASEIHDTRVRGARPRKRI